MARSIDIFRYFRVFTDRENRFGEKMGVTIDAVYTGPRFWTLDEPVEREKEKEREECLLTEMAGRDRCQIRDLNRSCQFIRVLAVNERSSVYTM